MARKKAAQSPAVFRAELAKARGFGTGGALEYLQQKFTPRQAEAEFLEWRNNPVTLLMIDAMRELSMTPPASQIDTDDLGVQYGVSSMAAFAASFFGDPRVVYPHLFSGATPGEPQPLPETDYGADEEPAPGKGGK